MTGIGRLSRHITDLSVAEARESAADMGRPTESPVSRHHIQPPAIYMPPPPKPKETKRKRGVGTTQGARATDETGETDEAGEGPPTPQARGAGVPQHQLPAEGAERKIPSPNGKLSDDTLRAMLEMQEEEGGKDAPPQKP